MLVLSCASEKFDKPRKKPKWVKMETPPGTVWLRDSLFIDKHEISNLDYLQFLWWLSVKEPTRFKEMLPDTNVWISLGGMDTNYVKHYLRHPAYQDFPIVGISKSQAEFYSNWRSARISEMMHVRDNKVKWNLDSSYNFPIKVRCRLPNKEEWNFAAHAGLNYFQYPLGYESMYRKDSVLVDYVYDNRKRLFRTVWVESYFPNRFKIYHMLGNVSELTSDGYIKGLNFLTNLDGTSPFSEIKFTREPDSVNLGYTVKSYMKYEKPAAWLGFRCVCEVLP